MRWIVLGTAALVVVAAAAVVMAGEDVAGDRADVTGQGGEEPVLAADGATVARADHGLRVRMVVPTPEPGSYEYPTGDMVPEWATGHPEIVRGSADEPEVFTLWVATFSYPERCTDDACDLDDLAVGAAAKGGVYQADGRIVDGGELELVGSVRIGQVPMTGSPLENPHGAEVHLSIAPHGKALSGEDVERQLNGPVGNPTLWWAAFFHP